jgi:hypothetical protein
MISAIHQYAHCKRERAVLTLRLAESIDNKQAEVSTLFLQFNERLFDGIQWLVGNFNWFVRRQIDAELHTALLTLAIPTTEQCPQHALFLLVDTTHDDGTVTRTLAGDTKFVVYRPFAVDGCNGLFLVADLDRPQLATFELHHFR